MRATRFDLKAWSLLLLAGSMLAAPARAQTRRALLIGIDRYDQVVPGSAGESGRGLITNLRGAVNDVVAVRDVLVGRFEFPAAQVRVLRDSQATRAGILAAIQQLTAEARPGDVVIFYYAGHGAQRVNSLSRELGKRDQTIVPSDANAGVFDIRDKELARAFNPLVDKGVSLTLIFDSCHSGSIMRGVPVDVTARFVGVDPRDAKDADDPPQPEARGALVISAAQDYQTAGETRADDSTTHGIFTNALLRVLRQAQPDEPAVELFQSVKAIMQSQGGVQEPVLAGTLARRQRALLGGAPGSVGRTVLPLLRVKEDNSVELQGGRSLGVGEGSELTQLDPPAGSRPARLKVTGLSDLSRSTATIVEGNAAALAPGTRFAVTAWVAPGADGLRLWLPPATMSAAELQTVARELNGLRSTAGIEWVEDPAELPDGKTALLTLAPTASGWELQRAGMAPVVLGRAVTAAQVAAAVQRAAGGPARLVVLFPPSAELRRQLSLGAGTRNNAVTLVPAMKDAKYLLVGRAVATGIEYAWILPNATRTAAAQSALPVRTDWIDGADSTLAGGRLQDLALRLAKLSAWLSLEAPPDSGQFPYKLAFKNLRTGAITTQAPLKNGERFTVVLRANPATLKQGRIQRRWVYLFAVDSRGKGVLLFGTENVQNRFPLVGADGNFPASFEIKDGEVFNIQPPFGIDTFFLLTSEEALSPDALAWEGVRTRSAGGSTALQALLSNTGAATRGPEPPVPPNWSIQRLMVRSTP